MKDWKRMQVGNFIVEEIEMDKMDFIEVRTLNGEWRVMYRSDHSMFHLISSIVSTDTDIRNSLRVIFTNIYSSSTIIDAGFHNSIIKATNDYNDSVKAVDVSDTEDAEIIETQRNYYKLKHDGNDGNE